ncbi:MAG: hypothetical protein MUC33_01285 [Desulfobacterales bacterium]|jgi:uncharacterized protein YceH (UPF0502 family)|nr:hypothetical protein [Desulfobacterales bacterium]MCU0601276.1 hypothetical protein [Desulfobacterales bacterium]
MDVATIQAWLPTTIAVGAIALIWADMRGIKRQLATQVSDLASTLRHALYREDGQTHFMPRNGCEREQARCQQITCGKIEALSVKMDLFDSRREHAKEQSAAQMSDVKQALAVLSERVEQLSEDMTVMSENQRRNP